jgi:acid phosphatase
MHSFTNLLAAAVAISVVVADDFNILQHVGGNGQWFPGKLELDNLLIKLTC